VAAPQEVLSCMELVTYIILEMHAGRIGYNISNKPKLNEAKKLEMKSQ
jgi:hypothetical protein